MENGQDHSKQHKTTLYNIRPLKTIFVQCKTYITIQDHRAPNKPFKTTGPNRTIKCMQNRNAKDNAGVLYGNPRDGGGG